MALLNTNFIHNVLNVAIAVTGGVTTFLLATGCTTLPTGAVECSQSFIGPEWTAGMTAILALTKTGINVVRDGLSGLMKAQPPVR